VHVFKRILLVALSALLGVLCFPPFGFSFISVIAWLPLLVAMNGASAKVATRIGVLHGLVFYGATLSWLTEVFTATPFMIVPLVFVMASFTGLYGLLFSNAGRLYKGSWKFPVLSAVLWTGIELFRTEIFILKFPWMTPGLGLGPTLITPIVGVYGVGFVVILGCCLLIERRFLKWGIGVLGLVICACAFLKPDNVEVGEEVRILALQSENGSLEEYLEMIAECEEYVDIILLPEYAFGQDVRESEYTWKALTELARRREAVVVVGTRTELEDYWYNTALTLTKEGEVGVHYKNHPVHFFDDGRAGELAEAITAGEMRFGTPICFDNDYEGVVRRMTADGATFFAVPSLDAKSWTEREHWQHAELFRHRAAENGRWMVVSTGSGITQLIDSHGVRRQWLAPMDDGWMHVTLPLRTSQTLYNRFGWLFPWVMLIISCAWIIYLSARTMHILFLRRGKLS
jgi:apolipoprotein N-acyltransferase